MKIIGIKGVPEDVAKQFSVGAAARGITQAQYLTGLLELRSLAAEFAEPDDDDGRAHMSDGQRLTVIWDRIRALGLETISA